MLSWGLYNGNFFIEAKVIINSIWGIIMLVDLYISLTLALLFICLIERSFSKTLPWLVGMYLLGNVASLIYLLINYKKIKNYFKIEEQL